MLNVLLIARLVERMMAARKRLRSRPRPPVRRAPVPEPDPLWEDFYATLPEPEAKP